MEYYDQKDDEAYDGVNDDDKVDNEEEEEEEARKEDDEEEDNDKSRTKVRMKMRLMAWRVSRRRIKMGMTTRRRGGRRGRCERSASWRGIRSISAPVSFPQLESILQYFFLGKISWLGSHQLP